MGVIIHLSNGVKRYASINSNAVQVTKTRNTLNSSGLSGDVGTPPVHGEVEEYFTISGDISVWELEDDYREQNTANVEQYIHITSTSNTLPSNVYTEVYTKFTSGLTSFTDDF